MLVVRVLASNAAERIELEVTVIECLKIREKLSRSKQNFNSSVTNITVKNLNFAFFPFTHRLKTN